MIRVGIGGWTFAPWRGPFYPKGLPQARELAYAGEKLTAIEINGTFYRTQSAASFAKWRDEVPAGFKFTVKGHRSVTNRSNLGEAGEAVGWFLASGLLALGDKLGPLLWQFAPFKKFDAAEFSAFLALLPAEAEGIPLRHAVELRHESFLVPEAIDLARKANVAIVFADAKYPTVPDVTADFVYARLQDSQAEVETGYAPDMLDNWAERAKAWQSGQEPKGLPRIGAVAATSGQRDVYVFMINGAKERAPLAAMGLIERL